MDAIHIYKTQNGLHVKTEGDWEKIKTLVDKIKEGLKWPDRKWFPKKAGGDDSWIIAKEKISVVMKLAMDNGFIVDGANDIPDNCEGHTSSDSSGNGILDPYRMMFGSLPEGSLRRLYLKLIKAYDPSACESEEHRRQMERAVSSINEGWRMIQDERSSWDEEDAE